MPKLKSKNYLIISILLPIIFIISVYWEARTYPLFQELFGLSGDYYILLLEIWWISFNLLFIFFTFYGIWLAFRQDYGYSKNFIWLGTVLNLLSSLLLTWSIFGVRLEAF